MGSQDPCSCHHEIFVVLWKRRRHRCGGFNSLFCTEHVTCAAPCWEDSKQQNASLSYVMRNTTNNECNRCIQLHLIVTDASWFGRLNEVFMCSKTNFKSVNDVYTHRCNYDVVSFHWHPKNTIITGSVLQYNSLPVYDLRFFA